MASAQVIKFLLVAAVVSAFMVDEIGQITSFDSTQITTVAVLMVEFVFVFGAHSWVCLPHDVLPHKSISSLTPSI